MGRCLPKARRPAIAGDAEIGSAGNAVGSVNVTSSGTTKARTASAGIAAGAVGVGVNIALAVNVTRIRTYIGQGTTLYSSGVVTVDSQFDTHAEGYILSVAAGAVGVGVSVVIVVSYAESLAYIGSTPGGYAADAKATTGVTGAIHASGVRVNNNLSAEVFIYGFGLAAGGVAVNGLVALGINIASAVAAINKINIYTPGSAAVKSAVDGDTTVITTALVGGGVAVGATVALALLATQNKALIDVTNVRFEAGSVSLSAGTLANPFDSEARTIVVTGAAGGVAVAVNFAIAINSSKNFALLQGTGGTLLALNAISVQAIGNTRAYAIIANVAIGGVAANISLAISVIRSEQKAVINLPSGTVNTGAVTVTSEQNTKNNTSGGIFGSFTLTGTGTDDKDVSFTSMSEAFIFSASADASPSTQIWRLLLPPLRARRFSISAIFPAARFPRSATAHPLRISLSTT